jgi:hypothetical protein
MIQSDLDSSGTAAVSPPSSTSPVTVGVASEDKVALGPRFSHRAWLTLLHLICIGVFAAFLCWGQSGSAPINGDDVGVLQRTMLQHTDYHYDYLTWTRLRLHVVGLLNCEYHLAGNSIETANLIWLAVYVLSAFASYAYLRKVFNPTVALTGAIFYFCYSSKYEPLTWWSAGAYTLIWLGFFGLMYALESKLPYRAKVLLISVIVGLSLYIYEVFLVLVPLIAAILLFRRKREVSKLRKSDWLFAALPIVVVLVHLGTLATAPEPIFSPSKGARGSASLVERVTTGFTSAIDATVGPLHHEMMKRSARVYKDYYQIEDPVLNRILIAGMAIFILSLILGVRASTMATPNLVTVTETALIGAVALLVSAFIGFISNYCVTPSRLTGIPSIGLMLLLCAILESIYVISRRCSSKWKFIMTVVATALPMVALVVSMREAKAFHSLLKQAAEVDKFDLDVARKIKSLHPVAHRGDEVFVRMPKAPGEVIGRWQNFWSGFNSGRAFETFWYLYDVPAGYMDFRYSRYKAGCENEMMQEVVDKWSEKGTTSQVYPFFVDANRRVMPITEIILTDVRGNQLKKLDFSQQFRGCKGVADLSQTIPITKLPAKPFQ